MRKIYINGDVYTVSNGMAEAFVVDKGKFIYAGSNDEALKYKDENCQVIDLKGRFVTAGFNDSHMHLVNYGYFLSMVNLYDSTSSIRNIKERLSTYILENSPHKDKWIIGRGWNQDYFEDEKRFPDRYDLDQVSTDYPIYITRACGHIAVVNSKALELMGVNRDTPQIKGEEFDVDDKGEPLGIFRENAINLIQKAVPSPSIGQIKDMIVKAAGKLNSYGITSVQTDDFGALPGVDYEDVIKAYKELEPEGKLTVKVYEQAIFFKLKKIKDYISKGYNTGVGTAFFRLGPLKVVADGSLGARTAYLSGPYSDDKSTRGIKYFSQEDLDSIISFANENGMQIAVHCIGDGILKMVLSAFEKALRTHNREDHRHGIVHCQITDEESLKKFSELKLHAYIQSIFLNYDINIVEERVGTLRAATSYNFKILMDKVVTSNGSDCPVELPDVMAGIQCAVTRKTLDGKKGPYLVNQALSMEEAIKSFTIYGAHSSFEEGIKGSIEKDKVADFVILERSPFKADEESIKDIKILASYLNGNCVYEKKLD